MIFVSYFHFKLLSNLLSFLFYTLYNLKWPNKFISMLFISIDMQLQHQILQEAKQKNPELDIGLYNH